MNNILFKKNLEDGLISKHTFKVLTQKNYVINKVVSKKEKISVIIPTYKRLKQLETCVKSILNQTYKNIEIIIVDDCSGEDVSKAIYKKFKSDKIKVLYNDKNSGGGDCRRIGFNNSTGDYIIFCDDDDYFIDYEYFERIINIFKNNEYSIICSNSYQFYENENKFVFNKLNINDNINALNYLKNFQIKYMKPYSTFTAVFRKEVLNKASFSKMEMMNDSSIYLRALIKSKNVFINKSIIGVYRIHKKNMTYNIKNDFLIKNLNEKKQIYKIIKKEKILNKEEIWIKKQIYYTTKYYISFSNPSKENVNNIFIWIKNNINNNYYLIFKIKLYYDFYKLKKRIKGE